jgi:hypothetical protein
MAYSPRTVPECIAIIQSIENDYKTWTTVQLIDNVRHIAPLDGVSFQALYGSNAGISFSQKGKFTIENKNDLIGNLTHNTDANNDELGISFDMSTARWVGLGHVLTGISAALYHDKLLTSGQRWQPIRTSEIKIPPLGPIEGFTIPPYGPYHDIPINIGVLTQKVGVDSLYAAIIAGDLGQTVTGDEKLWTSSTYTQSIG